MAARSSRDDVSPELAHEVSDLSLGASELRQRLFRGELQPTGDLSVTIRQADSQVGNDGDVNILDTQLPGEEIGATSPAKRQRKVAAEVVVGALPHPNHCHP